MPIETDDDLNTTENTKESLETTLDDFQFGTTHERPLRIETDDDLNTTENTKESLETVTALDDFQVGSFLFYILIGVGSSVIVTVVVAIAIVILITCLIRHARIKIPKFSLTASQLCGWRQRRSSNKEIPLPDITTAHEMNFKHSFKIRGAKSTFVG